MKREISAEQVVRTASTLSMSVIVSVCVSSTLAITALIFIEPAAKNNAAYSIVTSYMYYSELAASRALQSRIMLRLTERLT